jgi:DNA-binding transcriptional ArsR family regulator
MEPTAASGVAEELLPHAEAAASLLRSLGNAQRLMILCHLSGGALSVGDLNALVPLSQSALSQHLAKLQQMHLESQTNN